ncbi:MAG TPA: ABC transporter permease [Acidimicrobiales bacterium]|nr:ABC transporter permease [Acidimicrobiales bacterium]
MSALVRNRQLVKGATVLPIALVVWLVLNAVLPHGAPAGIILSGAVFGAINALVAISIVLVYQANRVVNFAAAEFGSVAAVLAIEFHIKLGLNFFVSILAGLVISAALGALLEILVIRRFGNAPRLIVMVVTIGLAQVLNSLSIIIPVKWSGGASSGTFTTPWNLHFMVFPVLFNANYVLAIVVVPMVLAFLVWFFKYTNYGTAIRAMADNGDRAKLLGVPVQRLSTVLWAMTGVLSALAVLLRVPILGFLSFNSVSSSSIDLLVQTLAAAVIGGMTSLPVTVVAAIGLGIAEQQGAWSFQNSAYVDVVLLVVVLVALLVKRDRLTRASDTGISTWRAIGQVRPVPPELADLREVRLGRRALPVALLVFAVALPYLIPPARTQLATLVLIYAMVGASLVVLTGWAGHISLGQVAFMGFGAATTGILVTNHGVDLLVALACGALVAGVVAVVIGIPALRISGPFLAVVTLAFALTSANYFLIPRFFPWFDPQKSIPPHTLFGRIHIASDREMYFFCLFFLIAILVALSTLRKTHAGRAMIAAKENRLATQSFGMSTVRLNLVAFAVSGAIAGLAGGLFVVQQQAYSFGAFPAESGLVFFTMVVIGGLGSIPGAVLGAVYVYGAQYLLAPGFQELATGAGIVLLLLFLPGGLGELFYRVRDQALRQLAHRRGLLVPSLLADRLSADADPSLDLSVAAFDSRRLRSLPVPGADPPDEQDAPDEPHEPNGRAPETEEAVTWIGREGHA